MITKYTVVKNAVCLAAGIILAGCASLPTTGADEQHSAPRPQQHDHPSKELRRAWPEHPEGMNYDRLVVVNTKKKDGQTDTSCTLPELQAGRILFRVKSLSVKNAQGREIDSSHAHGSSRVTFRAPEDQLPGITLDATYIDARSFKETTKDRDKRADWQVRFLTFKMSDLLKNR